MKNAIETGSQTVETNSINTSNEAIRMTDDIEVVQPIMPSPKCGTDVPEDNDLIAVHPLPLGPVFATGEGEDLVAVQPIMPSPKCGTDVPEDNDLIAVHPLPLGPVFATGEGEDLVAVQPIMP
ncbi:hypothetical protein, partial [Roseibium album]|uniref:hypothetical protein n=1 Tax=Roseibium album TaxID=311410 RepID=UPI0024937951